MPELASQMTPTDLGLVGLVLVAAWRIIDRLLAMIPTKTKASSGADPVTRQRIKELHNHHEEIARQIAGGEFQCVWRDRDEVRDFMDAIRENTREVRVLACEIRKSRGMES